MLKRISHPQLAIVAFVLIGLAACNTEKEATPQLRKSMDYATLTNATSYSSLFIDETGQTTVDLANGNNLYKMFQALNTYISSSISGNKLIDATVLKNMYANTGNAFADSTKLNISGVQLRNITAASWTAMEAEKVRTYFETNFVAVAEASKSVTAIAAKGKAGKLGTYLVDEKGIEPIQIIQKSLIGALQYDYIGNVLLTKGLEADNSTLLTGKNYTQLEQNWDEAYGLLTLNPIYLKGATDAVRGTTEFALGAYIWEYNKGAYANIYPAFLRGRAAIVNNDKAELKKQADFIKAEMEKAMASSAIGYLGPKYVAATTDAARAHAIAEGLGFIYSLRFATVNGADAAFSDNILKALIYDAPNGFWDLTPTKITAASDAIKTKFKL
ncbi:MAG: DUF4856 domain-containing protein [Spirosomataceae bacterium]